LTPILRISSSDDPTCLSCHGPVDTLDPELREALAQRFPDDEATGYQLGELRGAYVAELPGD
jgi:hypothetical protein